MLKYIFVSNFELDIAHTKAIRIQNLSHHYFSMILEIFLNQQVLT
jgi:hypothetical protein